jgi:hypothetical protein
MKFFRTCFFRLLPAVAVLLLAACAGTQVNSINSSAISVGTPLPRTVAVIVENHSPAPSRDSRRAGQLADANQAVAGLTDSLQKMMSTRHLIVVAANQHPNLILRCNIVDVRSGNEVLRVLVGYGAGRAVLQTHVSLAASTALTQPLLAFETSSTTGRLPGASAGLASGSGLSAGGAALGIPGAMKQGLARELSQTTEHIDDELGKYFVAQNWPYVTSKNAKAGIF